MSLRITGHKSQSLASYSLSASDQNRASIPFATALRQHKKLVILGDPGAGKTTTLSYAFLVFAQNKGLEKFSIAKPYLPIFIHLRRLSGNARSIVEDILDESTQIIPPDVLNACPSGFFEKRLQAGRCIILLDGLDEVVDEETYRKVADRINEMVAAYPENRYVVTCRVAGWKSLLSGDFDVLQTQNFNRDEIQRFVYGWHRAVITQSEYRRLELEYAENGRFEQEWALHYEQKVKPDIEIQTRHLLSAVDKNPRIQAIAVNPMLLSLINLVHLVWRILPRARTRLYKQCVELLIENWDRTRGIIYHRDSRINVQQKEAVLCEIAYEFQRKGVVEDSRASLEKFIAKVARRLGISMSPKELLAEIEQRSGLLTERSIDVFSFSHLTLQEYFVAKQVESNSEHRNLIFDNLDKQEWREVTLLYAGLLADATELVKKIAASHLWPQMILAGHCVGDAQSCDPEVAGSVITYLRNGLKEKSAYRKEIAEALAAITADFQDEPLKVEEKLSAELINFAASDITQQWFRLECISALARARVTKALPVLTELLMSYDHSIREATSAALVAFGNLAIPEIEKTFFHDFNSRLLIVSDKNEFEAQLTRNFHKAFKKERPHAFAYARHACIETLKKINTTAAAKAMMNFYEFENDSIREQASLALSQMLANPLIEADLRKMSLRQMPVEVRNTPPDDAGWPHEELSPSSGFLRLDTLLRKHLFNLLIDSSTDIASAVQQAERLRPCSFKILYPVLLKAMQEVTVFTGSKKKPLAIWQVLEFYGFYENEKDRIAHLYDQVRENPSMTLEYALRNAREVETSDESGQKSKTVRFFADASVFILTLYALFQLLLIWTSSVEIEKPPGDVIKTLLFVLPSLLYLCVFVLALSKFRLRMTAHRFISTFLVPHIFFLHALPQFTRIRLRIKNTIYHLALFLFSTSGIIIFAQLNNKYVSPLFPYDFYVLLLNLVIMLIVIGASLFYLKYEVLTQNPLYQLLLLHPEGRRIVGDERRA